MVLNRVGIWAVASVALSAVVGSQARANPSFQTIAVPNGLVSMRVSGLSADGSTVVATAYNGALVAPIRWNASQGTQVIGYLEGGDFANARAVNRDGSVITGYGNTPDGLRAYRWQSGVGFQILDNFEGVYPASTEGVSADGAVIVGYAAGQAVRWTAASGTQSLGPVPPNGFSEAHGVSADGSRIVGIYSSPVGRAHPYIWSQQSGFTDIGLPVGSGLNDDGGALAISSNGNVVVGWSGANPRPWKWSASSGLSVLSDITSQPFAISGDGSLIGGSHVLNGSYVAAVLWSDQLGMVDLNEYLPTLGLDLTGWQLTEVRGISDDGLTIAGTGIYGGAYRGWVVTIPAPATTSSFMLIAVMVSRRMRGPRSETHCSA